MKHILSTLMIAALALVAAPDAAAEYSPEMQELAKVLNESAAGEGAQVTYDGSNIIMEFPSTFFNDEEKELFALLDDLQPIVPPFIQLLKNNLGQDTFQLFGSLLQQYDTNFIIRLNLGSTSRDLTITPEQFINS